MKNSTPSTRLAAGLVAALIATTVTAPVLLAGGLPGSGRVAHRPRRQGAFDSLFPKEKQLLRLGAPVHDRRSGRFRNLAVGPFVRSKGLLRHRMDYWKVEGKILKIGIAQFNTTRNAEQAARSFVGSMQKRPEGPGPSHEFGARLWWRCEQPEQMIFVERSCLVKVQCFPRRKDNWQFTRSVAGLVLDTISAPQGGKEKGGAPADQEAEEVEDTSQDSTQ